MNEAFMVGMAEVKIARAPGDILMALGIGSCIGICAYDPQARIAGLAHVVLPESNGAAGNRGKFADTAVPYLIEEMIKAGAMQLRLKFALVGGAQLFAFGGSGPRLDIGPRNARAVEAALQARSFRISATDVGGSSGRTVHFFADGLVRVKTLGQGERELVKLT